MGLVIAGVLLIMRANLAQDTRVMFRLNEEREEHIGIHKECGSLRCIRDYDDMLKICYKLEEFKVFDDSQPELICIATNLRILFLTM